MVQRSRPDTTDNFVAASLFVDTNRRSVGVVIGAGLFGGWRRRHEFYQQRQCGREEEEEEEAASWPAAEESLSFSRIPPPSLLLLPDARFRPRFASFNAPLPSEEEAAARKQIFFASAAAASSNKQIMDRVLLRHLKQESKCMSRREKITSIDSDTSAPRVTEHKTSASELNSLLLQADVLASKIKTDDSADNSDAFLTATSDQLKTVEWTSTRRWSGSGWRGNKSRGYFGLHLGLQRRS